MGGRMSAGRLRQKIAHLERIQEMRISQVSERKAKMDAVVEVKQREIENLKAMLASFGGTELKVAT